MTKLGKMMITGLKQVLKAGRCDHRFSAWEMRRVDSGIGYSRAWHRRCSKCNIRETVFKDPT